MDFPFLSGQCFGDEALQRELLELFLLHADGLVAKFHDRPAGEQDVAMHRLKGSSLGVGAWLVAAAAQEVADAAPAARGGAFARLLAALAEAEAAIRAFLASL